MLLALRSQQEREDAQNKLVKSIKKTLRKHSDRTVGFRVGSGERNPTLALYSRGQGKLWFTTDFLAKAKTPRYWNAFGFLDTKKSAQQISVEINIPRYKNSGQVSGFFARDSDTNRIYLLHDGGIGGGRPGIGKKHFLALSNLKRVPVLDTDGRERLGIVISELDAKDIVQRIGVFAETVSKFKEFVSKGEVQQQNLRQKIENIEEDENEYLKFNNEFSGKKRGHKSDVKDYISSHGSIVNALSDKLKSKINEGEQVFNTLLIDVGVSVEREIKHIYEIKTGSGRQAIYTAVGQLMIHSKGKKNVRKTIVLPEDEFLPAGVRETLKIIDIEVLTFRLKIGEPIIFFDASRTCLSHQN